MNTDNKRPNFDKEMVDIADYVSRYEVKSELALETAYYVFLDALACAFLALKYKACTQLLGPLGSRDNVKNGVRVPGTHYCLDLVQAAFNFGSMIRWLDYNDAWLAAEWAHPSDNIGGILSVMDFLIHDQKKAFKIKEILPNIVKAHEIQGVMALENSFNRVGLDHVILVKLATCAVATHLLGGDSQQIANAVSQVWIDGASLRTYRHAPNTGPRKSWAAGDATSRGIYLALLTMRGEIGYPSALTAKRWGLYDVYFQGHPFRFSRPYGSYVIENVLFKISFPAEFHAQTAIEAAIQLHPLVKDKLKDIKEIRIKTQESAMRIINKSGPLYNSADRDHCLQYMIAIGLIFGTMTAEHYQDQIAKDPRIDTLRQLMIVEENIEYSKNYLDENKRSIGNAIQVFFKDGAATPEIAIEYPIGHVKRREEGIPLLLKKFKDSVSQTFNEKTAAQIINLATDKEKFLETSLDHWMALIT